MISGYARFFKNPFFRAEISAMTQGFFAIFIRPDYPQKVNLFQTGGASPRGRFGFSLSEKSQ
jgi:hypothetical protein